MKLFMHIVLALLLFSGFSFAQFDLDLTKYAKVSDLEKDFEGFNNSIHAGMSTLEWTEAGAPSVFGGSVNVFYAMSSLEKAPAIGLSDEGFTPSALGLQVGFGTAGFEVYARYLPAFETGSADLSVLGFGLKYDLSDLIPVPALPAISAYASYNTQTLSASVSKNVTINNISGDVKTGMELDFSTINIGAIVGYDLIVLSIYGKAAVELGSTDMTWNQAVAQGNTVVGQKSTGTFDNTGFRYAVGLALFGIRAEFSGRGSNIALGVGYGISI